MGVNTVMGTRVINSTKGNTLVLHFWEAIQLMMLKLHWAKLEHRYGWASQNSPVLWPESWHGKPKNWGSSACRSLPNLRIEEVARADLYQIFKICTGYTPRARLLSDLATECRRHEVAKSLGNQARGVQPACTMTTQNSKIRLSSIALKSRLITYLSTWNRAIWLANSN